jgi:hypothetical protein
MVANWRGWMSYERGVFIRNGMKRMGGKEGEGGVDESTRSSPEKQLFQTGSRPTLPRVPRNFVLGAQSEASRPSMRIGIGSIGFISRSHAIAVS